MQGAHPLMQGCKLPKRESAMVGLIPDDAAEEDPEVNEDEDEDEDEDQERVCHGRTHPR